MFQNMFKHIFSAKIVKWRLDLQENWEKTLLYIDWNIVIFNYIEYQSNTLMIFSNPSFTVEQQRLTMFMLPGPDKDGVPYIHRYTDG